MDGSGKRTHVVTGNTPKPSEKRVRENIHAKIEERPARRTVAFQGKGSPMQKVCILPCLLIYYRIHLFAVTKILYREIKHIIISDCFQKASRRILQKAKLVRSPESPKQLLSPQKKENGGRFLGEERRDSFGGVYRSIQQTSSRKL